MVRFRPRLRFSLRTLLVLVTMLGAGLGYAGWQWRLVQDRAALKAACHERLMNSNLPAGEEDWKANLAMCQKALESDYYLPWLRDQFGDEWVPWLLLAGETPPEELARVRTLFPEAQVYVVTGR